MLLCKNANDFLLYFSFFTNDHFLQELSAALLNREQEKEQEQFNVISVDWGLGASPPYTQAVANTRLVGAIIAHLIRVIQV